MKLYHIGQKIIVAVYEKDLFGWENTTNNALEFNIDELAPDNKAICIDLMRTINRVDGVGDNKYYMFDNLGVWELHTKDSWVEKIEEFF